VALPALAVASAVAGCGDGDPGTTAPATSTAPSAVATVPAPPSPDPGDGGGPAVTTTAAPRGSVSAGGVATTITTTATDPDRPALGVGVYWTRPADGDPVDLGFYADPPGGRRPYLLYGSVTNDGTEVATRPVVEVTWRDDTGALVHRVEVRPVSPTGQPLGELAPGARADLLVIVDDPSVAARLAGLTPELVGRAL
jgi:hypothetical protein